MLTSAHKDGSGVIGQASKVCAHDGLQDSRIFLGGHAVGILSLVGPDLGGVVEGLSEDVATVVNIRSGTVALDDTRTSYGSSIDVASGGVLGAISLRSSAVAQVGLGGESKSKISQGLVDLHDFGSIALFRVVGTELTVRRVVVVIADIARGEVGGQFTRVELILLGNLDGEFG